MTPRVGIVLGDPAGIGPEIVVKLLARAEETQAAEVVVIGERWAFDDAQRLTGIRIQAAPFSEATPTASRVGVSFHDTRCLRREALAPAQPSAASGAAVIRALELALGMARQGRVDAVCYGPLNKQALHLAGLPFPDELRFFEHALGQPGEAGEINVLGQAWTSRVTSHVPITEVPRLVTVPAVTRAIRLIHRTVRRSGVRSPRIAVAALNPHAGEGGSFGREEIEVIRPAIDAAAAEGIRAEGPFPADTVFIKLRDGAFDAVVTMYHDQGQIAMKLMGFQRGVTVSGGLSIPITTPAHGTAFDIAGRGRADAGAMIEAFRLALHLTSTAHDRLGRTP
jgi:4-hydroxythreonine-4-phosphate dehydrogenase